MTYDKTTWDAAQRRAWGLHFGISYDREKPRLGGFQFVMRYRLTREKLSAEGKLLATSKMMDSLYEGVKRYDEQLSARLKPLVEKPDSLENKFCQRLLSNNIDWRQFKSLLDEFNKLGFNRTELYELTRYVQLNNVLAEDRGEYLAEIMRNLTGNCIFEAIIRLNSEPQGPVEFREYVERIRWGWESI